MKKKRALRRMITALPVGIAVCVYGAIGAALVLVMSTGREKIIVGVWQSAGRDENSNETVRLLVFKPDRTYSFEERYSFIDATLKKSSGTYRINGDSIIFSPSRDSAAEGARVDSPGPLTFSLYGGPILADPSSSRWFFEGTMTGGEYDWSRISDIDAEQPAGAYFALVARDARTSGGRTAGPGEIGHSEYPIDRPTAEGALVKISEMFDVDRVMDSRSFRVIGWSEDGVFAYAEAWENPSDSSSREQFFIYNTLSGDQLFSASTINGLGTGRLPEEITGENERALALFHQALERCAVKIAPAAVESFLISPSDPLLGGDGGTGNGPAREATAAVILVKFTRAERGGDERTRPWVDYEIVVRSSLSEKRICRVSCQSDAMRIVGFVRSPFGKRIVVLMERYYGTDDARRYIKVYDVHGCAMDKGFKRR